MSFTELNSVEYYIIKQLAGVNLNQNAVSEPKTSYGAQWAYKSASELNRSPGIYFVTSRTGSFFSRKIFLRSISTMPLLPFVISGIISTTNFSPAITRQASYRNPPSPMAARILVHLSELFTASLSGFVIPTNLFQQQMLTYQYFQQPVYRHCAWFRPVHSAT